MKLRLAAPPDFSFPAAVCSHGFFMLAPNCWAPDTQTLRTSIAIDDDRAVTADIRLAIPRSSANAARRTMPRQRAASAAVVVRVPVDAPPDARAIVRRTVSRMLRLDEDFAPFHRMCRAEPTFRPAARLRFGRLLRGATLFEDIVKVICTCNIAWRQTVAMTAKLVDHYGVPCGGDGAARAFPTPARVAAASAEQLRRTCSLGYRADYVHALARSIVAGDVDLAALEASTEPTDSLTRRLRQLRGVGDYAAASLAMILGRYDRLAIDSEMVRFVRERTGRTLTPAAMRRRYDQWQPYAYLAYWWELWSAYTDRHGPADSWSADDVGARITD